MRITVLKRRTIKNACAAIGCAGLMLSSAASVAAQQNQPISNRSAATNLPAEMQRGQLETVAEFTGAMPTGVTVSSSGRIFVNFPRWEDPVEFSVAEIRNGRAVVYPDANLNRYDPARPGESLVSVQSVVVDPADRLWIVDTGSINFNPIVSPAAPKLICVDLATNKVVKTIKFAPDVVLPTTYLNDIRFDLRKGAGGTAYLTDSSSMGPNALIVVDLASGTSRRLLSGHPSVTAEPLFTAFVEGMDLKQRRPNQPAQHIRVGADGIAISNDGARLFYCPLASRRLYSVATAALLDQTLTDSQVAQTVKDEGEKPAADGLETDAQGRLYSTAYEHNGIQRRKADGSGDYETIVSDRRVLWADTLAVAADGYLYFINNQLHRQKGYNNGRDLRQKPYTLFRVRNDGTPIRLR